jgi:hypothetical protein
MFAMGWLAWRPWPLRRCQARRGRRKARAAWPSAPARSPDHLAHADDRLRLLPAAYDWQPRWGTVSGVRGRWRGCPYTPPGGWRTDSLAVT